MHLSLNIDIHHKGNKGHEVGILIPWQALCYMGHSLIVSWEVDLELTLGHSSSLLKVKSALPHPQSIKKPPGKCRPNYQIIYCVWSCHWMHRVSSARHWFLCCQDGVHRDGYHLEPLHPEDMS